MLQAELVENWPFLNPLASQADAETCISLNAHWGKGYARKGAALHQLGLLQEALEAYRTGLTFDPISAILKRGLEEVSEANRARLRECAGTNRFVPGELTILNADGSVNLVMPPVDPRAQPHDPDFLIDVPPLPVDNHVVVDARGVEAASERASAPSSYEEDDHDEFKRGAFEQEGAVLGGRAASNGVELRVPPRAKPLLFKDVPAAHMRALSFQDEVPPATLRLTVFEQPAVDGLKGMVLAGCRPGADMLFSEPDGPASGLDRPTAPQPLTETPTPKSQNLNPTPCNPPRDFEIALTWPQVRTRQGAPRHRSGGGRGSSATASRFRKTPEPGTRNTKHETRITKPQARSSKHETGNTRPETRNPSPKPETRRRRPETRSTKPETRNPKPEARNPKPETRNPKPATRNPQPATRNPQPAT